MGRKTSRWLFPPNPSLSARLRSKKVSRNRCLLFLYLWRKFTCRRRCENKRWRRAAFCAVGLQGPLRRAEGKGVKRSDHQERSSQSLPLRKTTKQKGIEKSIPFVFISISERGLFHIYLSQKKRYYSYGADKS